MKQSAESSSHSQTSFTLLSFPFSALCAIKAPTQQTHKCRVVFPVWWRISAPLSSCVTLTTLLVWGQFQPCSLPARQGRLGILESFVQFCPPWPHFSLPCVTQTGQGEVQEWEKVVVPSQTAGILPRWDPPCWQGGFWSSVKGTSWNPV